jgi:D-inositol-3-phosphate glycosyltransferase
VGIADRALFRIRSRGRRPPPGSQEPQYDAVRRPFTWTRGWVLVEEGYSRVDVSVSGAGTFRATLHAIPRSDVARLSAHPSAPISGWQVPLDIPDLEPGTPVTVSATASGRAGSLPLGEVQTTAAEPFRREADDLDWARAIAARLPMLRRAERGPGDPIRILVFTHRLDLGGAQRYLHELLRRLVGGDGVEATVVSPSDGPLREELESWGIPVHPCEPIPGDALRYEARLEELGGLACGLRADVVIANTVLAFDGIDLASRLKIPAIWAIHDSMPVERCEGGLFWGLDEHVVARFRAAVESPAVLVFEADATRDLYHGYADPERLLRIDFGPSMADIDAYRRSADREALRAAHGIAPDQRLVVCVGTLEARKAQSSLALAFASVALRHPDAVLALVGDRGTSYSDGIRRAMGRTGAAAERVRIEPISNDVPGWLEMADAFAIASDVESMPLSIMEAMAFGLPVLGTRAWGIPELVDEDVTGLLCEPQDFDSLTDGLDRLLSLGDDERAAMGAAAQRKIRTRHNSGVYEREYRELLARLLASPDGPAGHPDTAPAGAPATPA